MGRESAPQAMQAYLLIPDQQSNHRCDRVCISYFGPLPSGDLDDFLGVVAEGVPYFGHGFPDMFGAFEHPVGKASVFQDGEERFGGVQFRTVRRQSEQ